MRGATLSKLHPRVYDYATVPKSVQRALTTVQAGDLARALVLYGYEHGGAAKVSSFCRHALLSRRAMGRRCHLYGMPVPKVMLRLGALLRARDELLARARSKAPVTSTASAASFGSVFIFSAYVWNHLGLRPEALAQVSPEWVALTIIGGELPPEERQRRCAHCGQVIHPA